MLLLVTVLLQELEHPNIVRLFHVFNRRSNVNLVLEHMTTDLEILLNEQSIVFGLGDIKAYMYLFMLNLAYTEIDIVEPRRLMIVKAMCYCHSRWTLHRDLKPSNCLISEDGTLKLSDFGLAKVGVAFIIVGFHA